LRSPRSRITGLLVALALLGAVPAASVEASPQSAPQVVAAKSCGSGYTHAVMPDGAHKCLRAGQFCSHQSGWQRAYHRYGFHCKRNGHLTYY
jgi:hypothetical protein